MPLMSPRAGSTRVAWADGVEVRVLDLARGGPTTAVDVGRVAGRALRATPSAEGASFLLEMARPVAVDSEEVQPVLFERGRAREASPPIRVREGLDVLHHEVRDRQRLTGVSNYGFFDRLWVGILDLAGVWWLIRRRRRVPQIVTEAR